MSFSLIFCNRSTNNSSSNLSCNIPNTAQQSTVWLQKATMNIFVKGWVNQNYIVRFSTVHGIHIQYTFQESVLVFIQIKF